MENILENESSFFIANNTRYVFLDGTALDTIEKCYATLSKQLSLPDYFGNNLDALEEVMNDLDWIKEKNIVIIIAAKKLLLQHNDIFKNDFLEILETSSLENISLVYLQD